MTRAIHIRIAIEMARQICAEHGGALHSINAEGIWIDRPLDGKLSTGILTWDDLDNGIVTPDKNNNSTEETK